MATKEELKRLVAQGDAQAMFDLARIYMEEGNLESLALLEQAAELGHPIALKLLDPNLEFDAKEFKMMKERAEKGEAYYQYPFSDE